MTSVLLRAPSVGAVVKKMIAVNPELTAQDLIHIIKQSVRRKDGMTDGFDKLEVVDEAEALRLARAMAPISLRDR